MLLQSSWKDTVLFGACIGCWGEEVRFKQMFKKYIISGEALCVYISFNTHNILVYAGLFNLKENTHIEQKGFISAVTETFQKW